MFFLFQTLNLDNSWLYLSPELRPAGESFQREKDFRANIKVVNDAAEKRVKLQANYAANLTVKEEQQESLLQIVERHRQKFSDFRKSTLSF